MCVSYEEQSKQAVSVVSQSRKLFDVPVTGYNIKSNVKLILKRCLFGILCLGDNFRMATAQECLS